MSIAKSRALEYRNSRTKLYETDYNETDIVAQYIEENAFVAGYEKAIDDSIEWMNENIPIITTNIALADPQIATIVKERAINRFKGMMT